MPKVPKKINYLLGRAERLVRRIPPPKMDPSKAHPYSFETAQERLIPKLRDTADDLSKLPESACPGDEAVALITLHPSYLAKSYFPDNLLDVAQLRAVGSRKRIVSPDAFVSKKHETDAIAAEIFVAGKRSDFQKLPDAIGRWTDVTRGALDLIKVEDVRSYSVDEKLRAATSENKAPFWEVILHASILPESDFILDGFRDFAAEFDIEVDLDQRLHAQGLCFLPVKIERDLIEKIAEFSFMRLVREMPKMRPIIRAGDATPSFKADLPDEDVVDPTIRVAVFDGGLPESPDLSRWSSRKKAKGVGQSHPRLVSHGLGVTSAILFGPLEEGVPLPRPYAKVDHYRVLDENSEQDETDEYFDIIKRIMDILETGRYDFANFSIGPDLPVDDDNVHVWTAMLDQFLRKGSMLAGMAAGNSGESDMASGNARIQSPADCVNAICFGSADSLGPAWKRSAHSSIGPGRSPGVIKPDLLSFGGSAKTPFYVLGPKGDAIGKMGTSFALPAGLRAAIGVRAYLGPIMSSLALKALLINRADSSTGLPQIEIGWGKVAESIEQLITVEDTSAHIVYRDVIAPGSWMRAPIPVPEEEMSGLVELSATFCFACDTDPQDPINYTRGGLEVRFRPHNEKKKDQEQDEADTSPFFSASNLYAIESELRGDAHKWETTLHASRRFRGSSLKNPVFNIHYHAREGGGKPSRPQEIPYALIVSVRAPKVRDLYDRIARRYRTILEAMKPVVDIQIR